MPENGLVGVSWFLDVPHVLRTIPILKPYGRLPPLGFLEYEQTRCVEVQILRLVIPPEPVAARFLFGNEPKSFFFDHTSIRALGRRCQHVLRVSPKDATTHDCWPHIPGGALGAKVETR